MTVVEERVGQEGLPHAIKTTLGWIASGGKFVTRKPFIPLERSAQHQMLLILQRRLMTWRKRFVSSEQMMTSLSFFHQRQKVSRIC